jgi:type II secretory pathway component PulF
LSVYLYKAKKLTGEAVEGQIPADSERAALQALERMNLFPLDVRLDPKDVGAGTEAGTEDERTFLQKILNRRVSAESAARFARELADLSSAGVPILRALDAISERDDAGKKEVIWGAGDKKEDKRARAILRSVRRDVAGGASLADALARRPELFAEASIGVVRAGEAGGFLDEALRRVATFGEREVALKRKVKSALAYPTLLIGLGFGAVCFLLAWVVPRFTAIYKDLGGSLPLPTRILVGTSDFIGNYWWLLSAIAIGAGAFVFRLFTTEDGKNQFDRWTLHIPLLRGVIGRAALARFARTLGTLLTSGVPILSALEVARGATGNREFSSKLLEVIAPIREGSDLATPLEQTRLFPPEVIEMVSVGQESGALDKVLERIGDRADEEVDQALRILVAFLEPMLVVAVAGVVFFVVVAALLPVFSLNNLIK